MAKKDRTTIRLKVKQEWELGKGHASHRSGAGPHQDKRTKRNRTRTIRNKKAIEEQ